MKTSFLQQQMSSFTQTVFGSDEVFILEHQCFNGICFMLAAVFMFSAGVNYLIGLNMAMVVGVFLMGVLFCFFFYLTRYRGMFFPLYWIVFVFGVLFVNLVWFNSAGISGTATIISLNIIAVVSLILNGWRRFLSVLMVCINLAVLYGIQYYWPDLVIGYANDAARYVDVFFTFSIAVLIISYVIYFTVAHFRQEKEKVKDREEKLKAIIDNIPDSVWLKDAHARFTMVNKPFSDNCGVPIDNIIGATVFDIWPEEMARRFEKDDDDIIITGQSLQRQEHLKDPNSSGKWFDIVKTPMVDQDGQITGIVGIARDITARYEYEDRLKKYGRIVDTSNDQMALINNKFQYEAANASYLKAHGLTESDLPGKTVELTHAPLVFKEKIFPHLTKAFKGEVVNYQDEIEHHDTGQRFEDVSYYPHKDSNGNTVSVVAHIKDVTEKKQMEQRLVRSEKMEAIGTLAGGIAHDFNNILSGILGYAQLGKINLNEPGKLNRHLDQIIQGSQRAGELIQQILTFSRQYDSEKQPLQTARIIKEALKLIRATIPTYIDIKEEIDSDSYILANPSQMHQIVMNLCTNAYQSISDTRGKMTVSLTELKIEQKQAVYHPQILPGFYQLLKVTDTGKGMDEQTKKKIFEPYFTTKEQENGTGLGLALVHGIIEELGGFVKVVSKVGVGSSFYIYLPVMDDDLMTDSAGQTVSLKLSVGSGHIMVVDDETSILFSTRELLSDCGYKVSICLDGKQALDEFKKDPDSFDLVITDMTMPKLTGDVLARKMLEIRPDLPIILCTGYSDRISEKKANEIGIRQFLQKPLHGSDLTSLIRDLLTAEPTAE